MSSGSLSVSEDTRVGYAWPAGVGAASSMILLGGSMRGAVRNVVLGAVSSVRRRNRPAGASNTPTCSFCCVSRSWVQVMWGRFERLRCAGCSIVTASTRLRRRSRLRRITDRAPGSRRARARRSDSVTTRRRESEADWLHLSLVRDEWYLLVRDEWYLPVVTERRRSSRGISA